MTDDSIDPQCQLLPVIIGVWSELKTVNAFTSCSLAIPRYLFESDSGPDYCCYDGGLSGSMDG